MIWQMTNPTSPPPSVRAPAGSRRVCCPVRRTSSPTPSKTAMSSRSPTSTTSYNCDNVLKQTLLSLTHCLMLCSRLSTSLFFSPFSSLIMRSSRLWRKRTHCLHSCVLIDASPWNDPPLSDCGPFESTGQVLDSKTHGRGQNCEEVARGCDKQMCNRASSSTLCYLQSLSKRPASFWQI